MARRSLKAAFAAAAVASGIVAVSPASAQDSITVNGTMISVGGGVGFIELPDVKFTGVTNGAGDTIRQFRDSEFSEYGGNVSGSIETPLGNGLMAGVRGFYTEADSKDRTRCSADGGRFCFFSGLTQESTPFGLSKGFAFGNLAVSSRRDVDHWGAMFELTRETSWLPFNSLFKSRKIGIGFDARGIDQDLKIAGADSLVSANTFAYNEKLDTRYYGGYLTFGGEYSLGNLFGGLGGLWDRWGLRSFFTAHAGIYGVDVDYDGALSSFLLGDRALSLSDDDVAFIGGVKFETRKQISPRMALSLLSEYEYYSFVPEVQYKDNDAALGLDGVNDRTFIDDDDAFASRTSLRLTIGLGDRQLYAPAPEPYK